MDGKNCKWTEIVLTVLILLFAFIEKTYSKWIIIIAAIILLIHAVMCKCHTGCTTSEITTTPIITKPIKKAKASPKKKAKKRN